MIDVKSQFDQAALKRPGRPFGDCEGGRCSEARSSRERNAPGSSPARAGPSAGMLLGLGRRCPLLTGEAPGEARSYANMAKGATRHWAGRQALLRGGSSGRRQSPSTPSAGFCQWPRVSRDDEFAAYFFRLAADQGHSRRAHAALLHRYGGEEARGMVDPEPPEDLEGKRFSLTHPRCAQDIRDRVPPGPAVWHVYPRLAMAVIRVESNFNPAAVSPKNAQGLMQLIPETSARFNVKKPSTPKKTSAVGWPTCVPAAGLFPGRCRPGRGGLQRRRGCRESLPRNSAIRRDPRLRQASEGFLP